MPARQNLADSQFAGLTLGISPRQQAERAVMDGQNFIVPAEGPKAWFGNRLAAQQSIPDPENAHTFRFSTGEIVIVTDTGIWTYNTAAQQFVLVVWYPKPSEIEPWSYAFVGGVDYVCRWDIGIFGYDSFNHQWIYLKPDIPGDPYSITETRGRLICETEQVVGYSVIDDASDFTNTDAGAGYQALSIIGGGKPLGVRSVADGFLTFTDAGVLHSISIDAITPFYHDPKYARDDRSAFIPLNGFCSTQTTPDDVVILTSAGLGSWNNERKRIEPYQEMISEALRQDILPRLLGKSNGFIKIQYAPVRQYFTISWNTQGQQYLYDRALVLYTPMDKFGSFDELHYAFGDFRFDIGPNEGLYLGFICDNGVMHYFVDDQIRETMPNDPLAIFYRPVVEDFSGVWGSTLDDSDIVNVASTHMRMMTANRSYYPPILGYYVDQIVDLYPSPSEPPTPVETPPAGANPTIFRSNMYGIAQLTLIAAQRLNPPQGHQPSWIDVGLYRPAIGERVNEASTVDMISIGTRLTTDANQISVEDWMEGEVVTQEDWEDGEEIIYEDWMEGFVGEDHYDAYLYSSESGYVQRTPHVLELEPAYSAEAATFYEGGNTSIYHWIRIDASNENQKYQLKLMEVSAIMAGTI